MKEFVRWIIESICILLLAGACIFFVASYVKWINQPTDDVRIIKETVEVPVYKDAPPEVITVEKVIEIEKTDFQLSGEDIDLIARVVYAEAGNQDEIGKRLVADVILNRLEDPNFPNMIYDVVYEENQFATPAKSYTESEYNAVIKECERRIDNSILWFRTDHYHTFGTPAYVHGDHYFNKKED